MKPIALRRTTILVTHDDPLLCAGLVAALREHAAFGVFVNSPDTVNSIVPEIDVVIADYRSAMRLATASPSEASRRVAAARILALTSNDREADIRRAIEAGIHGYLLLGGPIDELIEGVTTVANGARFLCRSVAQRMAESLSHAALTSRETEVLRLVMTGESNKVIARQLHIEVGTVKSHMSAIMTKLGAASRTQAAGIAATRGLVEERVVPPSTSASHQGLAGSRAHSPQARHWDRLEARA